MRFDLRVQIIIDAPSCHQLVMISGFDDTPLIQHINDVGITDSGKPVRYDKRRAITHEILKRLLHDTLGGVVERGSRLVQQQNGGRS